MSITNLTSQDSFAPSRASQQLADKQPRLMDKTWEVIQKKTFTNWINNNLKQKGSKIEDIEVDLSDGVKLIQLLEIIGDESLGRYNKAPKMRIQKVENMNTALAFIKSRGVGLTNIGAEDLVDSNVKLVLGLIWSIILRFTIADISEEGLTAKEGLLLWVQKRTTPYVADFTVKDFTMSWISGLPFCALIHRHRPDLLDYWKLDKTDKKGNTAMAFQIAEEKLGIARLLDVEDITDVAKPDERSVMTYVAQYFHAFSQMDKVGNAGRRVGQFGQVMAQTWAMQNDYETRVRKLQASTSSQQAEWKSSTFENYPDAKRQLMEFESYKVSVKREWVTERRELDTLLGNIQTKLKTYDLPAYEPPAGVSPDDLQESWNSHVHIEAERKRNISAYIKEIKEVLKNKYADAANTFQESMNSISSQVSHLNGELESQLESVRALISKLTPLQDSLKAIDTLSSDCNEANIEDNEYTIHSVEDLSFELGILTQSLLKKTSFLENQIVARSQTNITPQQMESFTETFRHFDKDHTNTLNKNEFNAAIQAEGISISEEEVARLYPTPESCLAFQPFIDFMKSVEEDKTSPEQLEMSFAQLAGDKKFVTEADMRQSGLKPEVVEYYMQAIPKTSDGNGYDFKAYLSSIFKR